ncbi:MAG: diaminopimelate decarboxylase, partial [Elusimicrobia bacterium]|nr:diaminopimelate decarboxylase [Elusimicrobiota bacterium]
MQLDEAFHYQKGTLYGESVSLERIAQAVGTPCYVYSRRQLLDNFSAFDRAFQAVPHHVCYALKANANPTIAQLLAQAGAGADIVSGGELFLALHAGFSPRKIVFAGVGKTQEEITAALRAGILMFNVESLEELLAIGRVAKRLGRRAPVAIRVNPHVDALTHRHITTGTAENKFGIPWTEALDIYRLAKRLPSLAVVGIHAHIGSQITSVRPYEVTLRRLLQLIEQVEELGLRIQYLDLGGGLGIQYHQERPMRPQALARCILPLVRQRRFTLVFEPGRWLVGNVGILLTRVLYHKPAGRKHFVIVDGGMTELIRPALYEAYHAVVPVTRRRGAKAVIAEVVGPVCESCDVLARDRRLPLPAAGDLLAILT